jgi:hypothetical protein
MQSDMPAMPRSTARAHARWRFFSTLTVAVDFEDADGTVARMLADAERELGDELARADAGADGGWVGAEYVAGADREFREWVDDIVMFAVDVFVHDHGGNLSMLEPTLVEMWDEVLKAIREEEETRGY